MKPSTLIIAATLAGCVDESTSQQSTSDLEELASCGPTQIQAGAQQDLLAVSDDNYAVYQEGQTVYATKLAPHAHRTVVASVPDGNIAFPLQVGNVVFVWTAPQRALPGFGVSPLVLWTSDRGPQLISAQSAVGLVATAATPDSQQIVFTTNATADGLRGDLAYARTRDALSPTILLHDIPLDFPSGICRPLASFSNVDGDAFPVAAYCAGTDTTATLSIWRHGTKRDLVANIATPMPFFFGTDPQQSTFLVNLADNTVETVTTAGDIDVLDSTVLGSAGFITRRGTVGYFATTPSLDLRLRGRKLDATVTPFVGMPVELYNRTGYSIRNSTSPDGSLSLYAGTFDPNTGFTDVDLVDIERGTTTLLEPSQTGAFGSEQYTSDSRFALYFTVPAPTAIAGKLFAGNRAGSHQIGTRGNVFDVLRAVDGLVSYSDNAVLDPARQFFASTADLVVADPAHPDRVPHLIGAAADLAYYPTGDRRRLVFTSQSEAAGAGLYIATAR